LKNIEKTLLSQPFEDILATIRDIPSTVDAPVLIEIACNIPIKRREIDLFSRKVC
jgi:hypothetical protein